MDTKEKSRETARKRRPAEEQPRKRPDATVASPRTKKPASKAAESAKRRRSQAPAEQPRQRREQSAAARPRPERSTPAAEPRRRTQRTEGLPVSAPQGTGPRKSAPQPSAEELAALRRQQRARSAAQPKAPEKKNALQNFISGVKGDASVDAAEKAEQRRKERAARAEKKRKQAQRHDTPAVIYTQPMAFSRDKLLIQLLTVTAVGWV